jgi:iron-sulfur cluster insertion protein
MINITENAKLKIKDVLIEENNPNVKLRMFVQGGGCSGFSYGFTLDEEQNEDDFVIENDNYNLLVDAMSMQYLEGATVDYVESLMGSSFSIKNPNAESTCGCGSSFSINTYDDYIED